MKLLTVENLCIDYVTRDGVSKALDDISFSLETGERLGIIGESGCGKSTLAKSLMRLLPPNGVIREGKIVFKNEDLVEKTDEEIRRLRWKEISFIAQSAMNALNPVRTIGDQIVESILVHTDQDKKQARSRAAEVFEMVGLEAKRLNSYPHQMSGGMKQRAIIAMALTLNPSLIIADEPTTALDVIVQDRILHKMIQLQQELNSSLVMITHDISVVAETCHTVIVMYGGKIMEKAKARDFFYTAYHPYSLGLQNAFPSITEIGEELISIPGAPPNLLNLKPGCRFQDRCPFAQDICGQKSPELREVQADHYVACHFTDQVETFRQQAKQYATWDLVRQRLESSKGVTE